jgi:nucleoid-associated protein YgaU
MGLIDFVKDAGESLLHQATDLASNITGGLFGGNAEAEAKVATALRDTVTHLGISVQDLTISVESDVATLNGVAASHADREKVILVAGNTKGIAQVNDQLTVQAPDPAHYYTVVSGDSLSKIAKAEYGDPMKYPVIFDANRPMLSHPDKIYPGQVLRIPKL